MSFRRRALASLLAAAVVATLPALAADRPAIVGVENRLPADAGVAGSYEFTVTYDPTQISGKDIARTVSTHGAKARVFTQFPVVAVIGDASAISAVAKTEGVK